MPRRSRFSTAGYVFHVLNRAVARQTIFQSEGDYDAFVKTLEEARRKVPMRVLAFVVMPNHWHLVLWPAEDDALSEFMRWLTVTHAQRWHAAHGTTGTGSLYQGSLSLCGAESAAGGIGVAGGVVEMVELVGVEAFFGCSDVS